MKKLAEANSSEEIERRVSGLTEKDRGENDESSRNENAKLKPRREGLSYDFSNYK